MVGIEETKELKEVVINQIYILEKWNVENIKIEPEQCRKNLETMLSAITLVKTMLR